MKWTRLLIATLAALKRRNMSERSGGFPCSGKWLAKLAVTGGGPVYRKAGRFPIYDPVELDAWAEARISAPHYSTSDYEVSDAQ